MSKNVILILTDQQHYDTLGCNGTAVARTPNIDRLARQGIRFDSHIVANTVCMPSRASIFTGTHINEHGVWTNGCRLPREATTITTQFNDNGFQTAHFGKLHLEPILNRIGDSDDYHFQTCEVGEGDQQLTHDAYFKWLRTEQPDLFLEYIIQLYETGHANGYCSCMPEEYHLSTWVTDRSIDWLANRRNVEKPFFLSVGYFDPHHAFCPCEPYWSMFDGVEMPMPELSEDDVAKKPAHYRKAQIKMAHEPEKIGATRRAYHGMVAHVDKCVGRIMDAVEQAGIAADTVIIFSSDHGEMLGNHGLLWKGPYMLDDLLRVPLVVGKADGVERRVTTNEVTSGVDVFASCCDIAGIDAPRTSGQSFVNGDLELFPAGPRGFALAEWESSRHSVATARTVRTKEWKYTTFNNGEAGELYDLVNDPGEMNNLHDDPASADRITEMQDLLATCYPAGRHANPQECRV